MAETNDTDVAPIALVTGANRGLGFETARQLGRKGYRVILTARRSADSEKAAARLRDDGVAVEARTLDVTDRDGIAALAADLKKDGVSLDVLVNNAAIALDGFDADIAARTIAANYAGPRDVTDALVDLIPDGGTVVMVSSGAGELTGFAPTLRRRFLDPDLDRAALDDLMAQFVETVGDGSYEQVGWPGSAYKVSKAGLNALARIFAEELAGRHIRVNAVCPGWVRTDMGGRSATRSIPEGAASILWAATLPDEGPTGGFFRDGEPIAW
ncbi:SDR family NAD(P)-dependent oxidoreductase [Bauldia sp.]|uniref:SDR family NAD(P)-dependent oxidoreductase n=1 Tax=Bauldia sp. TaxID=2575872 RepID=UPI003BA8FB93